MRSSSSRCRTWPCTLALLLLLLLLPPLLLLLLLLLLLHSTVQHSTGDLRVRVRAYSLSSRDRQCRQVDGRVGSLWMRVGCRADGAAD